MCSFLPSVMISIDSSLDNFDILVQIQPLMAVVLYTEPTIRTAQIYL
jgi:hypothetical protein